MTPGPSQEQFRFQVDPYQADEVENPRVRRAAESRKYLGVAPKAGEETGGDTPIQEAKTKKGSEAPNRPKPEFRIKNGRVAQKKGVY